MLEDRDTTDIQHKKSGLVRHIFKHIIGKSLNHYNRPVSTALGNELLREQLKTEKVIWLFGNTNSIKLMIYLGVGKMHESKALIAVTNCSNYTKSYGTILNSFSWPRSGEEQDIMSQINNEASMYFKQHK